MARTPQRSARWSLRQVSIDAGVSQAAARAAVRAGHLDADNLGAGDVLVLKVAVMLRAFCPAGELRPANEARATPRRDTEAVALLRAGAAGLTEESALLLTANRAVLARTFLDVSQETGQLARDAVPYLVVPVGRWAAELPSRRERVAA